MQWRTNEAAFFVRMYVTFHWCCADATREMCARERSWHNAHREPDAWTSSQPPSHPPSPSFCVLHIKRIRSVYAVNNLLAKQSGHLSNSLHGVFVSSTESIPTFYRNVPYTMNTNSQAAYAAVSLLENSSKIARKTTDTNAILSRESVSGWLVRTEKIINHSFGLTFINTEATTTTKNGWWQRVIYEIRFRFRTAHRPIE